MYVIFGATSGTGQKTSRIGGFFLSPALTTMLTNFGCIPGSFFFSFFKESFPAATYGYLS